MTLTAWVVDRLREDGFEVEEVGRGALWIDSQLLVYVAEPSDGPFYMEQLVEVINRYPECQAIVVRRNAAVGIGVVEAASDAGIVVGSLGRLKGAMSAGGDYGAFLDTEDSYLITTLRRSRWVGGVTRIGLRAWRIDRTSGLDPLLIITHDRYEFSVSELQELLEMHPGLVPDAFVITNPNTRGLSSRVQEASTQIDIEVHLLRDVFSRLLAS